MADWLAAHMDDAEARLGKPLILQEFGKALPKAKSAAAWARAVRDKRDPVYAAVYGMVSDALNADRALRGVLFWRWDLPVYAGVTPADYGLTHGEPTFAIIKRHSDQVRMRREWMGGCEYAPGAGAACLEAADSQRALPRAHARPPRTPARSPSHSRPPAPPFS